MFSPMQTANLPPILLSPVCTNSANHAYDLNESLIYPDQVEVFCELADPAVVLVHHVNSVTTP